VEEEQIIPKKHKKTLYLNNLSDETEEEDI